MTRDAFDLVLSAPIDPANPLHTRIIRERAGAAVDYRGLVASIARRLARDRRLSAAVTRGQVEVGDLEGEGMRAVVTYLVRKGAKPRPDVALIHVVARRAMIKKFITEPACGIRGGRAVHESLDAIYSALDGDDPYFVPVRGDDAARIVNHDSRADELEARGIAAECSRDLVDARGLLESFLRPAGKTRGAKLKARSLTKRSLAVVLLRLADECGIDTRRARAALLSRGASTDRNLRTNAVFHALLRHAELGIGDDDHGDPPLKLACTVDG